MKEAEHLAVQEFSKRIETHPHRQALLANLQQNKVYNPFSKDAKAMIRELGYVELFELCENYTNSKMFLLSSLLESRILCTALADNA